MAGVQASRKEHFKCVPKIAGFEEGEVSMGIGANNNNQNEDFVVQSVKTFF